jgi:hypothetical protein
MPTRFTFILIVLAVFFQPVVKAELNSTESGFFEAEQFVQGHLYNGMLQVWNQDRRSWNQLLNVHACGGEQQQDKLAQSYQVGHALFSRSILDFAKQQQQFPTSLNQAVLSDVSQLAYRLFSVSYAHGYARQISQIDTLDPGIKDELCGFEVATYHSELVDYPKSVDWKLSPFSGVSVSKFNQLMTIQAMQGYRAFNVLLAQQYEKFDALVYSHAYQNTQAYDQLFFEVNGFDNVEAYITAMNRLADTELLSLDATNDEDAAHAGFAYLTLASGYHWGTLSVLAMLEEEFPRLHQKAKNNAAEHINKVVEEVQLENNE